MSTDLEHHREIGPGPTGSSPHHPPSTSRRVRLCAVLVYGVVLVAWSVLVGLPTDPIGIFAWIWLGMVCWHVEAPLPTTCASRATGGRCCSASPPTG